MELIYIEPAPEQRAAFARWCLEQTPPIPTATAFGSNVPVGLFGAVPEAVLAGAKIDGHMYRPVIEGFEPDGDGYKSARLLDCGLCYEENGEEVHPHPECTWNARPEPAKTPATRRTRKPRQVPTTNVSPATPSSDG